jgi:TPR repeat protein
MTTRDYFTLLKKAEQGDHEAQFHVGHHYYRLQEFAKAHSWWLKSAKQNKSLGPLFNIGNLYFNGWGVRRDIKKALYYFKLVISKKIIFPPEQKVKWKELALFLIGKTYFDGTFVKRNKKKGLNYYEQAAKAGNINAASTLESIYSNEENYNLKKKIYYLKQCANAGLSYAHAELALLAGNDKKLFLKHFKEAMKDDKKVVNSLELTTVARDSLNKLFSKNRIKLKKIWKKSLKETSSKNS